MTQAVKRACDACHRRKVKCDGINPCRNCAQAQLSCTYNAIPQKKGPKGSRAKVISELRETQRQTSLSAKVQNRLNGINCTPASPSLSPTPGLLTSELVKDCVAFFFENMYTQLPILDRWTVEQQILYMEQNRDAYCLMASLCAFVMLQPGMTMPAGDPFQLDMMPGATIVSSQLLLEEALRVRKGYEYLDSITLNAMATNYFLFACNYGQEMHERAWYYLREATTMVHMVGMHKEDHYMQFDAVEASRRRRLFWLLYATERSYAIQRNRPLTLQATINFPTVKDDPADPLAHQLNAFTLLPSLFKSFDDTFLGVWNKARSNLSSQHISGLQKQLGDLVQSYLCQDNNLTDLHTNQSWLKSTVWQLTNGSVNGNGEDSISFQYPGSMSRDLLMNMASQFPNQGMELLNSGLIEKLMNVVHTMNEYLALQPASRDPFAVGPREHMNQLLSIVAMSRNGDHRFLPLLLNKMHEVLPRIINPMLQNPPENPNLANIDLFDGFGNAGMDQPAQMGLSINTDYDQKFSVEEYDKQYQMEMAGGTPESNSTSNGPASVKQQGSEMNSSFVGSPSIMSPGMEYPSGMSGFGCTPMSEMVMSPLGHQNNPLGGQSQHQEQQHASQHMNHGHEAMGQHHMNGIPQQMRPQEINMNSIPTSHPMGQMAMRPPQRQNSFHLQGPPQMRTVGDFQSLQRAQGMASMNNEIDFGALR